MEDNVTSFFRSNYTYIHTSHPGGGVRIHSPTAKPMQTVLKILIPAVLYVG
ncbi:MAG: hypothetical protein K0R69_3346 [Clostridia bacterium]|jgi:hypothetical protein|nr:hypothetical protein [Clostridia bacterium]